MEKKGVNILITGPENVLNVFGKLDRSVETLR